MPFRRLVATRYLLRQRHDRAFSASVQLSHLRAVELTARVAKSACQPDGQFVVMPQIELNRDT
jgi:hypothetical protein